MPRKALDISDRRYGRLVALRKTGHKDYWLCRCDCGAEKAVSSHHLRSGKTQSCGCLARENSSKRSHVMHKANTTHGLSDSPTYSVWCGMKARCENENHRFYSYYGGRGIKVCERWQSFDAFVADMGMKPPGMTIDRIDGDRNYTPGNCRWASRKVQQNNLRSNKLLSHRGRTMTMSEWADRLGINFKTLAERLRTGWTVEEALTLPAQRGHSDRSLKKITFNNKTLTIDEWARFIGIKSKTLRERLRKGWPLERALSPRHRINQYR